MILVGSWLALVAMAAIAPLLLRRPGRSGPYVVALAPLAVFVAAWLVPAGGVGADGQLSLGTWFPGLGVAFDLRWDGFSRLFTLLIAGIGTGIVIYGCSYLADDPGRGRLMGAMLAFMASMLGLVSADDAMLLFVFWEGTSVTSYLLIGHHHEDPSVRARALQALLVTGGGGLALLGGLLLLTQITGTARLSEWAMMGDAIRAHPLAPAAMVLVLVGAFTKSAQFPFHFWLPNAMAGPTPVSAFLHSATMVKAGIYLLARLHPVFGGSDAWSLTLGLAGGTTFLIGTLGSWRQTDAKAMLAGTTLAVLGLLVLLLGLGSELAVQSMIVVLLGHALYKAALFLVAGILEHETGTRELPRLAGLRKALPFTAVAGGLAALSQAGFPPFFGFLGKEFAYKSALKADALAPVVVLVAVVGNIVMLALALKVGWHPFHARRDANSVDLPAHEAPAALWSVPLLLGVAGLLLGLFPGLLATHLVGPAVEAIAGEPMVLELALWHGVNLPLLLSVLTAAGGLALYAWRRRVWDRPKPKPPAWAERTYYASLDSVLGLAKAWTQWLETRPLGTDLLVVLCTAIGIVGLRLLADGAWPDLPSLSSADPVVAGVSLALCAAAIFACACESKLGVVLALGFVGFGIAYLFLHFGAVDLAITQICVETLTVVLFVGLLRRLPPLRRLSSPRVIVRDLLVALAGGLLFALLVLKGAFWQVAPGVGAQHAALSYPEAYGRNVVNVILVDFRALDTLGEIAVLALAALGIAALAGGARRPSAPDSKPEA